MRLTRALFSRSLKTIIIVNATLPNVYQCQWTQAFRYAMSLFNDPVICVQCPVSKWRDKAHFFFIHLCSIRIGFEINLIFMLQIYSNTFIYNNYKTGTTNWSNWPIVALHSLFSFFFFSSKEQNIQNFKMRCL